MLSRYLVKRWIGLLLVCGALLAQTACRSVPTSALVSTADTTAVDWTTLDLEDWMARAQVSSVFDLRAAVSPDGQWLVSPTWVQPDEVWVVPAWGQEPLRQVRVPASEYMSLGSWSPDSRHFGLYAIQGGSAHASFDRVLIFHVTDENALTYDLYDPQYKSPSPFASSSWSPDSTHLAVALDRERIEILDLEGNAKRSILPPLEEQDQILGLSWTTAGLVYHVGRITPSEQHHELRLVDPDAGEDHRLLRQSPYSLTVSGWNASSGQLLVREQRTTDPAVETLNLFILDPETGREEHVQTVQGSQCVTDEAPQSRFTAIHITAPGESSRLWFLDWETQELREYGPIKALIGWRANAEGFLVVQEADGRLRIEIVRPQN